MEMTVCDTLGWYGECLEGDSTAHTGAVLLDCPSPRQAEKARILQAARWALRLDGQFADLEDEQEFWTAIVDRVSGEQLTSIAIIGHVPTAAIISLQGLELSQRVANRNKILAKAQASTVRSAELFQTGLDKHLPSHVQVSVVALFYHEDSGTLQLHRPAGESHTDCWRSVPNAPAC